jgi:hypothetical protein
MNATPQVLSRRWITAMCILGCLLGATGCVSKKEAQRRSREAYLQGRQDMMRMQVMRSQSGQPTVTFVGQTRNAAVDFEEGLTLVQAIVAAEYFGPDPSIILVRRGNQAQRVNPAELLNGVDIPLQAGDVIEIH